MKSPLLLLLFIVAVSFVAKAQSVYIDATKKISKSVTPSQIVDSLIKRFPNAKAVEYYQASPESAKNGWSVSEMDDNGWDEMQYYVLSFKRDNAQYYGLFKADGTLVRSSLEQKNAKLPDAVKTALKNLAGDEYQDYTLVSKTYYKTINHSDNEEYYVITGIKKSDSKIKKTITMDKQGKVLKVKG